MLNLYLFGWGVTLFSHRTSEYWREWDIALEWSWKFRYITFDFWTPFWFLIISAGKDNRP